MRRRCWTWSGVSVPPAPSFFRLGGARWNLQNTIRSERSRAQLFLGAADLWARRPICACPRTISNKRTPKPPRCVESQNRFYSLTSGSVGQWHCVFSIKQTNKLQNNQMHYLLKGLMILIFVLTQISATKQRQTGPACNLAVTGLWYK